MENHQQARIVASSQLVQISQAGIFLAVLLAVQLIGLPNPITGTLVNALLVFVLLRLGARYAFMLGILSPLGGIISGHLPAPLYPIMPVIITGNLLMLGFCFLLRHLHALVRYTVPAAVKALVIWGAGSTIVSFMQLGDKVKWLFIPVMAIQFFTAVAGIFFGEKLSNATQQPPASPKEN